MKVWSQIHCLRGNSCMIIPTNFQMTWPGRSTIQYHYTSVPIEAAIGLKLYLCTGAFLHVPYSFLLISIKFCNGESSAVIFLNCTSAVMLLNRTGGVVWALNLPEIPLYTC